jgi:prophage DNA circulation protein
LGQLPPIFTLDVFVSGPDAFIKRDNLRRVLDTPGSGILSHPVRGNVEVTVKAYSVRSTNNVIGKIDFSLTFETSSTVDEPTIGLATSSTLGNLADTVRGKIETIANNTYALPTDNNFVNEIFVVNKNAGTGLERISASINDLGVREIIDPLIKVIRDNRGLVSNPSSLFDRLKTIFRSASGLGNLNQYLSLINLVANIPSITGNTVRRNKRINAYGALVSAHQANALVGAYQTATAIDYDTVPDLEQAEALLSDAFNDVVEMPVARSVVTDPDIRADLLQMRSLAADLFDAKEQLAWKVENFDSVELGFAATTYRLYGSLNNLDLIKRLNPAINASQPEDILQVVGL